MFRPDKKDTFCWNVYFKAFSLQHKIFEKNINSDQKKLINKPNIHSHNLLPEVSWRTDLGLSWQDT